MIWMLACLGFTSLPPKMMSLGGWHPAFPIWSTSKYKQIYFFGGLISFFDWSLHLLRCSTNKEEEVCSTSLFILKFSLIKLCHPHYFSSNFFDPLLLASLFLTDSFLPQYFINPMSLNLNFYLYLFYLFCPSCPSCPSCLYYPYCH